MLVLPNWPNIFGFYLIQCGCWGDGCRESLHPSSSKAQRWNRNGSTVPVFVGVSHRAAVLLLGLEHENFYSLLVVSVFSGFILLEKKLSSHLEAELRERLQWPEYTEHQQTVCLEMGQRLEKAWQQDEEILICTKTSTSCLHTPAHAMITKIHSCVKCLQRESFMAVLCCARSTRGTGLSPRKANFPSQLFRPFKYLLWLRY